MSPKEIEMKILISLALLLSPSLSYANCLVVVMSKNLNQKYAEHNKVYKFSLPDTNWKCGLDVVSKEKENNRRDLDCINKPLGQEISTAIEWKQGGKGSGNLQFQDTSKGVAISLIRISCK